MSVSEPFALNVKSNKQKLRSHVEAVKGEIFGLFSAVLRIPKNYYPDPGAGNSPYGSKSGSGNSPHGFMEK